MKQMLQVMGERFWEIRGNLQLIHNRHKAYVNEERIQRSFDEEDMVFLKVNCKNSVISIVKFKKLTPRFCGPYLITKRIGEHAYKFWFPINFVVTTFSCEPPKGVCTQAYSCFG